MKPVEGPHPVGRAHQSDEADVLVGRTVFPLGPTEAHVGDHGPGDPLLIEVGWPDDAPEWMGYAEPHVVDGAYDSGWILLNPQVDNYPAGALRRLVLHELGHLGGLGDVADPGELMNPGLTAPDWGPGDLFGLFLTHDGGCPGAQIVPRFQAFYD